MRGIETIYNALSHVIGPFSAQKSNLQILMYHRIQAFPSGRSYLRPDWFADQMSYLADSGYASYTLAEVAENWPEILDGPKAVVLTYDDLWASHVDIVLPVIKQHGFVGTFFVPTAHIEEQRHKPTFSDLALFDAELCNWDDIRALETANMDIGAHTHTHTMMTQLSTDEVLEELKVSRQIITRHLHKPPVSFSYPFGKKKAFNSQIVEMIAAQGFRVACTTLSGRPVRQSNLLMLPRINIDGTDNLKKFVRKIRGQYDFLRWVDSVR